MAREDELLGQRDPHPPARSRARPSPAPPAALQRAEARRARPEDSAGGETALQGAQWERTSNSGRMTQSDQH